ncbi:MAG: hypothetical protein INF92_03105 [Rhodobacter sp.]|nr:hypothetical protein [Rhodobacter sp.]
MNTFLYEAYLTDGQVKLVECLHDADRSTAVAMIRVLNQELRTVDPNAAEVVRFGFVGFVGASKADEAHHGL